MPKLNCNGKMTLPLILSTGFGLILVLALIYVNTRNLDNIPGLQDFAGNIGMKVRFITGMQTNLFRSEQAEKSAVMADTDEASMVFADQSRRAAGSLEQDRHALESLIEKDPTDKEKKLLGEFSDAWRELRNIDQEILDFAVQNTNLKAMALSFGKGGEFMRRFENALDRLIISGLSADTPCRVTVLASQALVSAFKIYNLHALHIAEQRDEKMDEIEARMRRYSAAIDVSFKELTSAAGVRDEDLGSVKEAMAAYADLTAVTAEVINLSRRNTNVKSFQLSIGRKRRMVAQCDEILTSLLQAVREREFKATR
ncbi:MAG: MCP four helix bundle domain-containing protein [Pseudomonadota bacterium]